MQMTIPDDVYSHFRQVAREAQQPVEAVIVERLRASINDPFHLLPLDSQAELIALHHLSQDTLLTIAAEQMPTTLQQRQQQLMSLNSRGKLSHQQRQELERLVERGDRLMLSKAEAAAILKQRGYPVTPRIMQS